MKIVFSPESLTIYDSEFRIAPQPAEIYELLGQPNRIMSHAGRPPMGFRNNMMHYYDELGLFLLEHHASGLVQTLGVVFNVEHSYKKPTAPFEGAIEVVGVEMDPNSDPREFCHRAHARFTLRFQDELVFQTTDTSIHLHLYFTGRKVRRQKEVRIAVATFGFRGDYVRGR